MLARDTLLEREGERHLDIAEPITPSAHVLVVASDTTLATQLAAMLDELGFSVCPAAANGDEALRQAHASRPDAVLMALSLADGVEAAERLRAELELRVVYVTEDRDHAALERAHQTLPHGYVSRPLRPFDLRCSLTLALHQRRIELRQTRAAQLDVAPLRTLSTRELSVLKLIALGHTSKDVAAVLKIAKPTVDTYRRRLTEKLGVRERTDLVLLAQRAGLLEAETPRGSSSHI